MENRKLGVGVAGLDNWYHAFPVSEWAKKIESTKLVAVAEPDKKKLAEYVKSYSPENHYEDYKDLVRDKDVDIVVINAYSAKHREIAVAAAEAGKHVLSDKPIATTVRDANEMASAVKKGGVKFMWLQTYRYSPSYAKAKELIERGAIGKPRLSFSGIRALLPQEWPSISRTGWYTDVSKSGGGALTDHGTGILDAALWLFGAKSVESVSAQIDNLIHKDIEAEDYGIMTMKLSDGARLSVEAGWTSNPTSGFSDVFMVGGTEGSLTGTEKGPTLKISGKTEPFNATLQIEVPPTHWTDAYRLLLQDFAKSITSDEEPPVKIEEGILTLSTIVAAYESAKSQKSVKPSSS